MLILSIAKVAIMIGGVKVQRKNVSHSKVDKQFKKVQVLLNPYTLLRTQTRINKLSSSANYKSELGGRYFLLGV